MVEKVGTGEHKGLKWWILKYGFNTKELKYLDYYCAYVQLPTKNTDYVSNYSKKKLKNKKTFNHYLINGFEIDYTRYDNIIAVNGGVTFGVTNEKETIIGWSYNHSWNFGLDEPLNGIIFEIKSAINSIMKFYKEDL